MELFDSHCHIQSAGQPAGESGIPELWAKAGDVNPDDIITRAQQAGVTQLICVGCDLKDSQQAVSFVSQRSNCWAAIGLHPHETSHYLDQTANLERTVSAGLMIGVNGIATFTKNASQLDVYRQIPLDNLVLETDAPFLAPTDRKSTRLNSSHRC